MEVIYGRNKLALVNKRQTGVGLGNFDGLHKGHMALINTLIDECKKSGLSSLVYTFSIHPEDVLVKDNKTPVITTIQKKSELLSETSLDYLCFDEFDESLFNRLVEVIDIEKEKITVTFKDGSEVTI